MKKTNKKILSGIVLPLIVAVVLVSAVLNYYGVFSFNVDANQPITINGNPISGEPIILSDFDCIAGETPIGLDSMRIGNSADENKEVIVSAIYSYSDLDISYVGKLILTKKDIVTWKPISGNEIEIAYSIVGNSFSYEVLSGQIPEGYELVYAMDKENRFTDYATVKKVSEIDESLPMLGDWNINPEPDYCGFNNGYDDYVHCSGAKLWIIPSEDIGDEGVLSWINMANYYYETDLIYYSASADTLTIPTNSFIEFYPQIYCEKYIVDENYPVEITIE